MTRWEYAELTLSRADEYSYPQPDAGTRGPAWSRVPPEHDPTQRLLHRVVPTLWWKGPGGQAEEVTREGEDAVDYLNRVGGEGWEAVTARERIFPVQSELYWGSTIVVYLLKRERAE